MMDKRFSIKTASRAELEIAVDWAAKEGWNPGLHDAVSYYQADPEGFLIAYIGTEPVATISAVKYGNTFGFIGFYIVKEKYRNKGYGLQIWNEAIKRLKGRNIGLDGVVDQQQNYKKSGFKLAYRNVRYQGLTTEATKDHKQLVDLSILAIDVINSYDQAFFPDNRTSFLKSWINQPNCNALAFIEKTKLKGYGVIRPCLNGYKIGPLFADSLEIAEALFYALQARVKPKAPFFLDVPEVNAAAVLLAERHQMQVVFETARMYTGDTPKMPLERIFGVTSFELG